MGKHLKSAIYYEIDYNGGESMWNTVSHDFDSLDFGLDLVFADDERLGISWCAGSDGYALMVTATSIARSLREAVAQDVTGSSRWSQFIDLAVVTVELCHDHSGANHGSSSNVQAMRIVFDGESAAWIGAADYDVPPNTYNLAVDNIAVAFSDDVVKRFMPAAGQVPEVL